MHFSTALVAGTFALASSAFLIPPEVPRVDSINDISALWAAALDGKTNLNLDCPGCPFAGIDSEGGQWELGVENQIKLEFSIEDQRIPHLNGRRMVPDIHDPASSYSLQAPQVRTSDGQLTRPLNLDFILEGFEISRSEADKELHPFNFTIVAIDGHPVRVDTIRIDLLYSEYGITIATLNRIPFEETPGSDTCEGSLRWSLCRFRAFVAARMAWLMSGAKAHADGAKEAAKGWFKPAGGCKGGRPGSRPGFAPGRHGPPGGGHRGFPWGMGHGHHHGGPPGAENGNAEEEAAEEHHHRHMHGHHRIASLFRGVFKWLIIPALLGVIGGILASVVGMLAGQCIVFLWAKFARKGQRGNVSTARVVEVIVEEDEKDGLLVAEGEEPPMYEDVEAVIIEEKQ